VFSKFSRHLDSPGPQATAKEPPSSQPLPAVNRSRADMTESNGFSAASDDTLTTMYIRMLLGVGYIWFFYSLHACSLHVQSE